MGLWRLIVAPIGAERRRRRAPGHESDEGSKIELSGTADDHSVDGGEQGHQEADERPASQGRASAHSSRSASFHGWSTFTSYSSSA